jgi:rod shape-determining protein MreC
MESVLGRYRNLIILVGVLFLQVLGLAMQVKRNSNQTQDTRLIRIWAVGALSPFERAVVWLQNSTSGVWHNYFYLRGVRAENRQLKEQIEQMRLEQVRLKEDAVQARRLQTLLAFKEQYIAKTVAAQVIGSSGSDLSRVIYIDKGESAGIRRDMAVMTADGIVGKVLIVFPTESQVLLINDQSSGVGAILEKSRLQGVLRGTVNGEVVLERVMSDEQVPVGETLLTSGGDQIFPKGLPIGTIAKVNSGKDLFLTIKIRPAANLSKLEEVLVLVEKQERQATAEANVRVRAADILAQRLPSVPDKPPDAKGTGATPPGTAGSTSAASTGTKPPAQAKTEVKPQTGTATKTQNPVASKPVGTTAGAVTSIPGQTPKLTGGTTIAKKTAAVRVDAAGAPTNKPAIVEEPKPKPIDAAPQTTPQTPANENSPQ